MLSSDVRDGVADGIADGIADAIADGVAEVRGEVVPGAQAITRRAKKVIIDKRESELGIQCLPGGVSGTTFGVGPLLPRSVAASRMREARGRLAGIRRGD